MIDQIGLNTAYNVSALGDEKAQAIGKYLKENSLTAASSASPLARASTRIPPRHCKK